MLTPHRVRRCISPGQQPRPGKPFRLRRYLVRVLEEGAIVFCKVTDSKDPHFGFNALTGEFGTSEGWRARSDEGRTHCSDQRGLTRFADARHQSVSCGFARRGRRGSGMGRATQHALRTSHPRLFIRSSVCASCLCLRLSNPAQTSCAALEKPRASKSLAAWPERAIVKRHEYGSFPLLC
jgi:hypothetical protein